MSGTSWGTAIAFDAKGKAGRKWQSIRNRNLSRAGQRGLSGSSLHAAVMAIASADSSLVAFEQRG